MTVGVDLNSISCHFNSVQIHTNSFKENLFLNLKMFSLDKILDKKLHGISIITKYQHPSPDQFLPWREGSAWLTPSDVTKPASVNISLHFQPQPNLWRHSSWQNSLSLARPRGVFKTLSKSVSFTNLQRNSRTVYTIFFLKNPKKPKNKKELGGNTEQRGH